MSESLTTQSRGKWTSASSASADRLCHGRHNAQKDIPEEASKDADFGDAVHRLLAMSEHPDLAGAVAASTSEVRATFEQCQEIEMMVVEKFFGNLVPKQVVRERRMWIGWKYPTGEQYHSGKFDLLVIEPPKALIVDYKSLWGDVEESPSNEQLRDLVCLVAHQDPTLQEIGVAIIQPKVTRDPSICVYDKLSIARATKEMRLRVKLNHEPDAKRIPGDIQCRFCRARPSCKEWMAWSGAELPAERPLFEVPMIQWTPEQCAKFCSVKGKIEKWIEEGEKHVKALLRENPTVVPGYQLTKDHVVREPANIQGIFERFEGQGGTLDSYMSCLGLEVGKFKDKLRDLLSRGGKRVKEKEVDAYYDLMVKEMTREIPRAGYIRKRGKS